VAVVRQDGSLEFWQEGQKVKTLLQSRVSLRSRVLTTIYPPQTVCFPGPWLAARGDLETTVYLWRLGEQGPADEPIIKTLPPGAPSGTRLVLDGTWLFVPAGLDGRARILDLGENADELPEAILRKPEGTARYIDAAAVHGGRLLLACSDGRLELWERPFKKEPIVLRERLMMPDSSDSASATGPFLDLAPAVLDPALERVAFVDPRGAIQLWDLAAQPAHRDLPDSAGLLGGPMVDPSKINAILAFSQDGRWLLGSRSDGRFRLWELDRQPVGLRVELRGLDLKYFGLSLVVNSRRDRAAIISPDGNVQVWDLDSPHTGSVSFHQNPIYQTVYPALGTTVQAIAFGGLDDASSGRWLMTFSQNGGARKWTLMPEALRAAAGRAVGRNLTRAEWEQYLTGQPYQGTIGGLPPSPVVFSPNAVIAAWMPMPQGVHTTSGVSIASSAPGAPVYYVPSAPPPSAPPPAFSVTVASLAPGTAEFPAAAYRVILKTPTTMMQTTMPGPPQ
jgi:WD40 repeat protein